MTSSAKRPWFRFHLLTAVLMMIAAGGFILANIHQRRIEQSRIDIFEAGFPSSKMLTFFPDGKLTINFIIGWPTQMFTIGADVYLLNYFMLFENIGALALTLFAVAYATESLLRRREGCKR